MRNKLTYEDIKYFVEIESNSGCKLLSDSYNKSKDKLLFKCKCGENFEASFDNFKSSNKRMCNKCSESIRIKKRSLSYDYVKNFINIESKSGCYLIDTKYKNNSSLLDIKCKCGNIFKTTFGQFKNQNKRQCNICGKNNMATNKNRSRPRKSFEEIRNYIENNSECILLSDTYKNIDEKLKLKCNCGNIFYVSFKNFKNGKQQCNKCTVSSNRESVEYIKEYVKNNSECELLECNYINKGYKLKFKCSCGDIFYTNFSRFKYSNKRQCNKCGIKILKDKQKISYEEVKNYIESNSKCKLISDYYENYNSNISLLCDCGEIFNTTFSAFKNKNKRQCNDCGIKLRTLHQTKTHDEFCEEIYSLVKDEYTVMNEYKGNKYKILLKHNKCGHEYLVQPSSFLSGVRCPKCNGKFKKTQKEFENEVSQISNNEYKVIGTYKNSATPIEILHKTCGYKWMVYPSNFTKGSRCPKCGQSKGEKAIEKYLNNKGYLINKDYEPQKEFYNLLGMGGKNLSYDFYISKSNLLIEYQGEFHDGTARQQSEEDFIKQKEHDKRKRNFAKLNNIKLLEIWYWDFKNINTILDEKLK